MRKSAPRSAGLSSVRNVRFGSAFDRTTDAPTVSPEAGSPPAAPPAPGARPPGGELAPRAPSVRGRDPPDFRPRPDRRARGLRGGREGAGQRRAPSADERPSPVRLRDEVVDQAEPRVRGPGAAEHPEEAMHGEARLQEFRLEPLIEDGLEAHEWDPQRVVHRLLPEAAGPGRPAGGAPLGPR